MLIPNCIKLHEKQLEKFELFKKYIIKYVIPDNYEEEDCSMASPFVFEIFETGISTSIRVKAFGKECSLSFDDCGDICNDEPWMKYV